MNKSSVEKQGFISIILLVIVALVILYYLNIPLQNVLSQPIATKIGTVLKGLIITLWNDFVLLFQFIKGLATTK